MNYLDNENAILLVLAGIKAPLFGLDNNERRAQLHESIRATLEKEMLFKHNNNQAFVSSLSDIIIALRDSVSEKLKISQFKSILKDLLSAPHTQKKATLFSSYKKMKLTLSRDTAEGFWSLYDLIKPIQTKQFFIFLLEQKGLNNAHDVIMLARSFGIKLPSNEGKNIFAFKRLFENHEHAEILKDVINNLLDSTIPHSYLASYIMQQAQTRGYHFKKNDIQKLVELRKSYFDTCNDYNEISPIGNILKTIAFSSGVIYFSPSLTAFKINHNATKKMLSNTSFFFSILNGLLSRIGFELADITGSNELKNYIVGFIDSYPVESTILFVAANIIEYNMDDLTSLYNKACVWAKDPLNFGDDVAKALQDSFYEMDISPKPCIFPKRNVPGNEKIDVIDAKVKGNRIA